jgi:Tol biopolymer transport system component
VLDFGIAKALSDERADLRSVAITEFATKERSLLGTSGYMSPEQARGQSVDEQTDIWAFGCVLYEMLTGRRAFDRETHSDTIAAVLEKQPDWSVLSPETPSSVITLIRRCLEKERHRRVHHIGDARIEIEDAQSAPVSGTSPRGTKRINLVPATAIGAALLGTAFLGGVWFSDRRPAASAASGAQAQAMQLTNYGGSENAAALSPDGRAFVFVSSHGGTPDLWLRLISGGEPVRLTNDAATEQNPIYTTDGESIFYTRFDADGAAIWRIRALGGDARKVVAGGQRPAPSPDGRALAYFVAEPSGATSGVSTLVLMPLSGGGDTRVLLKGLLGASTLTPVSWSPDARQIAFVRQGLFVPRNLHVLDVATGAIRQVTHFARSNEGIQGHAWLPDNRHLVITYSPFDQATNDLGVLDVPSGTITRVTLNTRDSLVSPSLSTDGSRVVATARRWSREIWKVPSGPDAEANGRAAIRLLDGSWDAQWTFVSKDTRTLLFSSPFSGSRNLWTMPLDGSAPPRQLTQIAGNAVVAHSSLSPDGLQVAFVSNASGNSDIWTQNVDGSGLRQLTNDVAADGWPVWSPDGRRIVYNSIREGSEETWIVTSSGGNGHKLMEGFFRGDWIVDPETGADRILTWHSNGSVRFVDVANATVLWEAPFGGDSASMPVFSPDGRSFSLSLPDGRDRDGIWVFDVATRRRSLAVRFPDPFRITFRASWADSGKWFVVNRNVQQDHIVLFDRFWTGVDDQ